MNIEQYKKAGAILQEMGRAKDELNEFIHSVSSPDRYFILLGKETADMLVSYATESYNSKIAELEKEFENL